MQKYFYDLHIHSALSPCGDSDMTPNNVINMAKLCGLDIIALTDHNSAFNVPAFNKVSVRNDILLVPGIELTTMEEVHLLAYFDSIDNCCSCGQYVYDSLPEIRNNSALFGNQFVIDEYDVIVEEKDKLLLSALPFSIDECIDMIKSFGGIAVPAHVNKQAYSLIENLGFIPDYLDFGSIEVFGGIPFEDSSGMYNILYSSDAHYLENINDAENYFLLDSFNINTVIDYLANKVI